MSLTQKLSEYTAKIAELTTRIEAMTSAAEITTTYVAGLEAQLASLEASATEVEEARATAIAEHEEKATESQARIEELEAETTAQKTQLAHPAFGDAAAQGEAAAIELDGIEADESASLFAQYMALPEGKERAIFMAANKEAIQAEQNAVNEKEKAKAGK